MGWVSCAVIGVARHVATPGTELLTSLARGRLLSFLGGLLLTLLTIGALVVLVGGLLRNWQAVLAVLLTVAALVLLIVNIRELRRG